MRKPGRMNFFTEDFDELSIDINGQYAAGAQPGELKRRDTGAAADIKYVRFIQAGEQLIGLSCILI